MLVRMPTHKKGNFPMRRSLVIAAVLFGTGSVVHAQVELKNYGDANGYIDVQKDPLRASL